MKLNNQTLIALAAALSLIFQGYIFEYVLAAKPHMLVSFGPLILYIIYIISKGRIDPMYDNPFIWIGAIALLTLSDLVLYMF